MDNSYMRKELVRLLRSGGAHASFDDIVSGFSAKHRGLKPSGAPHSAWQLLEHMRIAQWDIVEYTRNPKHVSPDFRQDIGRRRMRHQTQKRGTRQSRRLSGSAVDSNWWRIPKAICWRLYLTATVKRSSGRPC